MHGLTYLDLLALLILVSWMWHRMSVRRAASPIRQVDRLLTAPQPHDIRPVDGRTFTHLHLDWYDERTAALQRIGFEPVADLEDATLTAQLPQMRTFVRLLVGERGRVRAAMYEVPRSRAADVRTWELITEMADGRQVITVAGGAQLKMDPPPTFDRVALAPDTDPAALLEKHVGRIPEGEVRCNTTVEECIGAWQRQMAANAAFRQGRGGLTAGEMQRIAGPERSAVAQEVYREMQRQHDGESRDAR